MSQDAEGWFADDQFKVAAPFSLSHLLKWLRQATVDNTMSRTQRDRLETLSAMTREERSSSDRAEEEIKSLESLHRELPIVLGGNASLLIDWFTDDFAGGRRFKTWAGQQSVLDIARGMHGGLAEAHIESDATLWYAARGTGLPFFFDSDAGGQGSALDVGFSFDPLAASETTRIASMCRPAVELLSFIGLQRFRPREFAKNRFLYVPWPSPLTVTVAPSAASGAIPLRNAPVYEFRLLYRTKYLKAFLPAIPFQGDPDE